MIKIGKNLPDRRQKTAICEKRKLRGSGCAPHAEFGMRFAGIKNSGRRVTRNCSSVTMKSKRRPAAAKSYRNGTNPETRKEGECRFVVSKTCHSSFFSKYSTHPEGAKPYHREKRMVNLAKIQKLFDTIAYCKRYVKNLFFGPRSARASFRAVKIIIYSLTATCRGRMNY